MFAAISTGPITHLDHLAPLCFLLDIPLIVTDEQQALLGKKFYPMVEMQYIPLHELTLDYLVKHYEIILTCGKFWAMELKPLLEMFYGKQIRFVFSPHGYSDKETFLQQTISQDIQLVYAKGNTKNQVTIGNIRYWFYQTFKKHFTAFTEPFFRTDQKTILYAPTWETKATGTSFFEKTEEIIERFGKNYHLLIKLHPLLEENNPAAFHRIMGRNENKTSFITDFPLIYPLLEKTDIFLGDYSSIGYDFLVYNRPMFFLKEGGELQKCGEFYKGNVNNLQKDLTKLRKQTARKAFDKCIPEQIKALLLQSLEKQAYSSSTC